MIFSYIYLNTIVILLNFLLILSLYLKFLPSINIKVIICHNNTVPPEFNNDVSKDSPLDVLIIYQQDKCILYLTCVPNFH